jgi:Flp pilus assembly protein CpaB
VPTAVPMVSIAVVSRDVEAYSILDSTSVATVDVEASTVATNTATSPSTLYGKMTLVPLTQGQPVRVDQLTETGFSNILAKGERAFSLAVPERSTFGNAITENDRVDLIWTAAIQYDRQVPGTNGVLSWEKAIYSSTKTLLQDVHVLRVITLRQELPAGQKDPNAAPADASAVSATSKVNAPLAAMYTPDAPLQSVLVLGLTDQQAEVVTFAREHGLIDLTLRSSAIQRDDAGNVIKDEKDKEIRGDKEIEKTTGIGIQTLIEQYGMPVPKELAPAP